MFCEFCGMELPSDAAFCERCGKSTSGEPRQGQTPNPNFYRNQPYNPYNNQYFPSNMPASTGLKIVSFLVPIVGIVLYFVDRDQKPQSAKDCLNAAILSFVLYVVFIILTMAFMVWFAFSIDG